MKGNEAMKKIAVVFLSILILLPCLLFRVVSESFFTEKIDHDVGGFHNTFNFSYKVKDGEAEIYGYNAGAYAGPLMIPSILGGYPVVKIAAFAYADCWMSSAILPRYVRNVGESAFENCDWLVTVVIPKSVSCIEENAFQGCSKIAGVWYEGSEVDRQKIEIKSGNDSLNFATWHYDACLSDQIIYSGNTPLVRSHAFFCDCDGYCEVCGATRIPSDHVYDGETDRDCNVCGALKYTPGDLDGVEGVSSADAIYLLYFTLFGEGRYPMNQPVDYDGDGATTSADAIYLLYHTLFGGERYPI